MESIGDIDTEPYTHTIVTNDDGYEEYEDPVDVGIHKAYPTQLLRVVKDVLPHEVSVQNGINSVNSWMCVETDKTYSKFKDPKFVANKIKEYTDGTKKKEGSVEVSLAGIKQEGMKS